MKKKIKPEREVKKEKEIKLDIKKMGVDIDKNEYMEIVLSNSNRPDNFYRRYQ